MPKAALTDPKFSTWKDLLWFSDVEQQLSDARRGTDSSTGTIGQLLIRRRIAIFEVVPQLMPIWKHKAVMQQLMAFNPKEDAVTSALKHLASLPPETLTRPLSFPISRQGLDLHSAPCIALACLTYIVYRLTVRAGTGQATLSVSDTPTTKYPGSKSVSQRPVPARQAPLTHLTGTAQSAQAVRAPQPLSKSGTAVTPQPCLKQGTRSTKTGPLRLLKMLQGQRPWTLEWHAIIVSLEDQLLKTDDSTFEEVLASRTFSEILNLLEFIGRSPTGADPAWGWLLRMAWDFIGFTQATQTFSDDTYSWLFAMRKHHELALVAWDIARRPQSQTISTSTQRSCAQNNTYRRWINEAKASRNIAGQRRAQIRVRMASHVVKSLQDTARLRPTAPQLPQSIFEHGSHARRFGGGRPRSERFRR